MQKSAPLDKKIHLETSFVKAEQEHFLNEDGDLITITPPIHQFEHLKNPIQTKLRIGAPNDRYEKEADLIADKVVQRITKPSRDLHTSIPRQTIQRLPSLHSSAIEVPSDLSKKLRQRNGKGKPLERKPRKTMEKAFGRDFSKVRIHTGLEANDLSQILNARAFTLGRDIFFNKNEYKPNSLEGQRLLAHELTHVVQQDTKPNLGIQRWVAPTDWLDYIGVGIDLAQLALIEVTYDEGIKKDMAKFAAMFFLTIDTILAFTPGAGGGGLTFRLALATGGGKTAWQAVPISIRANIIRELAESMGWPVTKVLQGLHILLMAGNTRGGNRGERNRTSKPSGTNNEYKKYKPHDNPKLIKYKDQNGKWKTKPKPKGFDEYWNSKHPKTKSGTKQ
ncbi:MAG: DUF4157 domain-containing protein [Bacteroidota bacterium]